MLKKEEVEKAVLSNALTENESLFQLLNYDEDIFTTINNKKIFRAIQDLVNSNSIISVNTVMAVCDVKQEYFIELVTYQAYKFEQEQLLKDLSKLAYERQILKAAKDLFLSVKHGEKDFDKFLDEVSNLPERQEIIKSIDIAELNNINIDELCSQDNYLKTGFESLDNAIIGIFNTHLIVVAAPPGEGKTTVSLNIASNIHNGLFISYEMAKQEIYIKLLARYSGIDSMKIERLKLTDAERKKINDAKEIIKGLKLSVIDEPLGFNQLISRMRKEVKLKKINVIVIDYLQLIFSASGTNQNERIENMTRILKLFAMQERVPIILISQLTKDSYKEDKDPTMSDLRGSGAIAQNANTIIFCKDGLIIGKARKGRIGRINDIGFNRETSEFYEKKLDQNSFNSYEKTNYFHN